MIQICRSKTEAERGFVQVFKRKIFIEGGAASMGNRTIMFDT